MLQQALDLHRKGQLAEAASFYREILTRTPQEADVLHLLGILEVQRKNPAAAIELIGRALALNPANAEYLVNYGIALRHAERFEEALASFDRALAIQPELMEALISRGNVLRNLGRFEDALASFDQALMLKPDFAEVIYNRGLALRDLLRFEEALVCFDRAVELRSGYVEAFHARARVLRDLMRFEKALAGFDHVLTLQPNRSEASIERGNLFREMQRFQDALTDYDRALGIQPGNADLLVNRGNVLADLGRFEDGLVSYDRALAINPRYTGALINRGNVLRDLKRFDEAAASFDRAIAIQPDYPFLAGHRLYFKMSICDWRDMQADIDSIGRSIEARQKAAMPFHIVATPLPASVQRICSEIYTEEKRPSLSYPRPDAYKHSRIRVGYFSTDFRSHAVAHVAAGLFDLHDRAKFEVTAFSLDIPARDAMRARLEKSFDRFVDVGAISDRDVVALARRLEIDIAVDLNGYTRNNRPGIFAMRAAPVQVSYLGYPGTMGAEFIDYIVADRIVIPEDQQRHYAEKIVYLPDTYQVNDSDLPISTKPVTRAECGLPEEGLVFCCFNNNFKLNPEIFDIWMRLLKANERSVLWLLADNVAAVKNLRAEAQARGVAPQRLIFAERIELSEYLARHRLADLFLDTVPYNGHATASAALWAGLPVLTCLGKTFPGRVAASLLSAIGLPELVANDLGEYEALAMELAAKPEKRAALRQRLADNRLSFPLFDTRHFTRNLETAYVTMRKLHQDGVPPEHIYVARDAH